MSKEDRLAEFLKQQRERKKKRYQMNMDIAQQIAELSTCDRAHVGAVIYNPETKKIEGMGYNGSLAGNAHCDEEGHLLVDGHCVRTIHAERNAIQQAGQTKECYLFVTHSPCIHCVKEIVMAGIRKVIYLQEYRISEEIRDLLTGNGIQLLSFDDLLKKFSH